MDKNRLWLIGSVLVMVLVLVGSVFLGIQPQLAAAATANGQRVSVEASNAGQAAVLAQLKKDFDGIADLKAELAPLSASVPSGTMIPSFVNQLDALAGTAQVTLDGFSFSDATPYTSIEAPAAVSEPATDSTSTATPAPAPSNETDETVEPGKGLPPVTSAQITSENFASLAMTVTVSGKYAQTLSFVNGLQTGERLFLVTGLTTAAKGAGDGDEGPGQVTTVISGLVYVLVPPPAESPATSTVG